MFQLNSSLYLTRGNHTFRVGFTGIRYHDTFVEAYYPAGQHNFNGQWTAGAGSAGFAFADTMLGLPREIIASLDIFDPNWRYSHVMPWAQDDWKVTPRLTVNLGIRYDDYRTGVLTALVIEGTERRFIDTRAVERPPALDAVH